MINNLYNIFKIALIITNLLFNIQAYSGSNNHNITADIVYKSLEEESIQLMKKSIYQYNKHKLNAKALSTIIKKSKFSSQDKDHLLEYFKKNTLKQFLPVVIKNNAIRLEHKGQLLEISVSSFTKGEIKFNGKKFKFRTKLTMKEKLADYRSFLFKNKIRNKTSKNSFLQTFNNFLIQSANAMFDNDLLVFEVTSIRLNVFIGKTGEASLGSRFRKMKKQLNSSLINCNRTNNIDDYTSRQLITEISNYRKSTKTTDISSCSDIQEYFDTQANILQQHLSIARVGSAKIDRSVIPNYRNDICKIVFDINECVAKKKKERVKRLDDASDVDQKCITGLIKNRPGENGPEVKIKDSFFTSIGKEKFQNEFKIKKNKTYAATLQSKEIDNKKYTKIRDMKNDTYLWIKDSAITRTELKKVIINNEYIDDINMLRRNKKFQMEKGRSYKITNSKVNQSGIDMVELVDRKTGVMIWLPSYQLDFRGQNCRQESTQDNNQKPISSQR